MIIEAHHLLRRSVQPLDREAPIAFQIVYAACGERVPRSTTWASPEYFLDFSGERCSFCVDAARALIVCRSQQDDA